MEYPVTDYNLLLKWKEKLSNWPGTIEKQMMEFYIDLEIARADAQIKAYREDHRGDDWM